MLLKALDGRSFLLEVDRYEHPDEELGPTKDNPIEDFDRGRFLFVTVTVSCAAGSWRATAPEMTTTGLENLGSWLESISSGQPTAMGIYFTERDLEFTIDEKSNVIFVHLYRDFLPTWMNGEDCSIAFPIPEVDLKAAVASIRSHLVRFPHRPRPPQVD